jgi:hypothetical protein
MRVPNNPMTMMRMTRTMSEGAPRPQLRYLSFARPASPAPIAICARMALIVRA